MAPRSEPPDALARAAQDLARALRAKLNAAPSGDWRARCAVIEQATDAITLAIAETIASEFNDARFAGASRLIDDQQARKEFVRRMNIVFHRWGMIVEPEMPTVEGKKARAVLCASGGRFDFGVRVYAMGSRTHTTTNKSSTQPDGKHIPYFKFAMRQLAKPSTVVLSSGLLHGVGAVNTR